MEEYLAGDCSYRPRSVFGIFIGAIPRPIEFDDRRRICRFWGSTLEDYSGV